MDRAVVLITVHKPTVTPLEEISLRQCYQVLGSHPIRLVCPEGLDVSRYRRIIPDIEVDFIPPFWQSSYANFALLKIEPFIYKRYERYEFMLFYELDAFVFRDELSHWCDKNFDYVGAPWFQGLVTATEASPFIGVGNGGFSLRRIPSLLRARYSMRLWWRLLASEARHQPVRSVARAWSDLTTRVGRGELHCPSLAFARGEDTFWGLVVNRHLDWFRVADLQEASRFSFEALPRHLFALNQNRLPFGCHAWPRYDFAFWRPHVEAFGHDLEGLEPPATSSYHSLTGTA